MKKKLLVPIFLAGMMMPLALAQMDMSRANAFFIGEYTTSSEYIPYGMSINSRMADEGFVLLKNDGRLPLDEGAKISIVGKSSTNLARGGAGSGAGSVSSGVTSVDLQSSLTSVGFRVNDKTTAFYKSNSRSGSGRTNGNDGWKGNSQVTIGETPWASYDSDVLDSFAEFNDVAIQVITREGSEGCDVLTTDATDSVQFGSSEKHALQLSDNEQDLFDNLHDYFDNIIIVINSSNIFECDQFMKDDAVSGILWIGNPGDVGPGAVGRILIGDVNPSGRTVDTWTRDFREDPTWQNFSDNRHTNVATPNAEKLKHAAQDTMFAADGSPMMSFGTDKAYKDHSAPRWLDEENKVVQGGINGVKPASYVSYEEGIYVDYRYYETRYADMAKKSKRAADKWYNGKEGVVFPFGYGLSYTKFEQEIVRVKPANADLLDENTDLMEVSVKVTNVGDWDGKDAVQLYWKAPYYKGQIEKADHVLCAFDKTKMLAPGESQIVHLTFHLQDVANYDFSDANNNGFAGYELDGGKYSIWLGKNAHEKYDEVFYKIGKEGIQYETDRFSGNEVKNRFTDRGFYSSMPGEDDIEFTQMSRANFVKTFPTHPTIEDRTVKEGSRFEEFLTHEFNIYEVDVDKNFEIIPEGAYRSEQDAINGNWSNQATALAKANRTQLAEMAGIELDDPRWDSFINEFTYAEMLKYVEENKMNSPGLDAIGKSTFSEGDGPQKFSIIWWVSSPIIAATFSPELARLQGECVGMESHIQGKSGWWGPAVNTHRSPFGGRNFEYYSADPFLMGRMAAIVVGTATDRGVYAYFKHFAVNDQEKNRESGISFVNEQALREIYLKSFQMVFEEGKSMGVMGSYNRLGLMETAASYPLMTEVLRGEWGFKGAVLSDMTHSGNGSVNNKCYECVTNRCIAGCNSQLDSGGFKGQTNALSWDKNAFGGKGAPVFTYNGSKYTSYTWWNAVRTAVKEIMYMSANCTQTNRGLNKIVNTVEMDIDVDADIDLEISLGSAVSGNKYDGKAISSVDYSINRRVELPEGLKLEGNKLVGKIDHVGLFRIDVIATLNLEGGTKQVVAVKYLIHTIPDMTESNITRPKNFNYMPIVIAGGGVVAVAAIAAVIIAITKKKKVA